jgi:Domain of unknown function (DUF4124)
LHSEHKRIYIWPLTIPTPELLDAKDYSMPYRRTLILIAFALANPLSAAQTIYKCPDATGKTVFTDTPCANAAQLEIKPASGRDKTSVETADPLANLRSSVNGDLAKRRYSDAQHKESLLQTRLDRWEIYRSSEESARKRYVPCGNNKKCEDFEHTKKVIVELQTEFNELLTARSAAAADQRVARREYFEATGKRLP